MRPFLLVATSLASAALAAPTGSEDTCVFTDSVDDFYSEVGDLISSVMGTNGPYTECDKSKITLPDHASGLAGPDGQKPLHVAIGRGTQNYTCSSSTADATPEAIGALANLYDVTCMAANHADQLPEAVNTAYKIDIPNNILSSLPPDNLPLLGHHFFQNSIPIFNLNTPEHQDGLAFTALEDKIDAPEGALDGDNGAVAWLYLSTVDGTVGDYSSVYRANTAAGQPPKTCEGMPSSFEMQYAANYYFFGK